MGDDETKWVFTLVQPPVDFRSILNSDGCRLFLAANLKPRRSKKDYSGLACHCLVRATDGRKKLSTVVEVRRQARGLAAAAAAAGLAPLTVGEHIV